jgi:hypothetical protein
MEYGRQGMSEDVIRAKTSDELKHRQVQFVGYYNDHRSRDSRNNAKPADAYFEKNKGILKKRSSFEGKYV